MKNKIKFSNMKWKFLFGILGVVIIIFFIGRWTAPMEDTAKSPEIISVNSIWTCSMHPQIQQPEPGKCPICGMDLIPLQSDNSSAGVGGLELSPYAQKLAEIVTAAVVKQPASAMLSFFAEIAVDETRLSEITARVPGRIERLFVDFTGKTVRVGEPLVEIYSPELLVAWQELVDSQRLGTAEWQKKAVVERLRLWGIPNAQISKMAQQDPSERLIFYSERSGVVVERTVSAGEYVKTGSRIMSIANLSRVWGLLDVYESDLSMIKLQQAVAFKSEVLPGTVFQGKVVFVDPIIDSGTRTAKIRIELANPKGELKPGMYGKADIVVKYDGEPLLIPASAPLITGKRAVVYVASPDKPGHFSGREIELGAKVGSYYIVLAGLQEGERVVVNGNFKIDSAMQLLAKPSMMNRTGTEGGGSHHHGHDSPTPAAAPEEKAPVQKMKMNDFGDISPEFMQHLDTVYDTYFAVQFGLSHDDLSAAAKDGQLLLENLKTIETKLLPKTRQKVWTDWSEKLQKSVRQIVQTKDIVAARASFEMLSMTMIDVAKALGSKKHRLLVFHCPMAFDMKGADWLQNKEGTENPYFGSQMFKCGDQTADLTAAHQAEGHHE